VSELVTLTPSARPPTAAPVWAILALTVSIGSAIILPPASEPIIVIAGFIGAIPLSMWAETRLYVFFSRYPAPLHLLLTIFTAPFALVVAGLAGGVIAAFSKNEVVVLPLMFAGLWFISAACGTAMVQFVDLFGSLVSSKFSTRILLSVLGMILVAAMTTAAVVIGIPRVVNFLMEHKPESIQVNVDGHNEMTGMEFEEFVKKGGLPEFLQGYEAKEILSWGFIAIIFLFLIPGTLSAAGKLGEMAMERVHPLDLALQRVTAGDLNVRVEEAGSVELKRLATQFNLMVASLDLAQKMERAFGAYVSKAVIDRIRAQHGEIALPSVEKEATVFFVDIRGFTALSEKLSPDRVLEVLNRYYGYAIPIVEEYEGYIDKFIGDAIYVVFNGPIDQPDHLLRAARCAIALQEKMSILNAGGAFQAVGLLEVGIGLASGPVVTGNVGTARSTQFSVIGDTVNLASRLSQHAPAGEVWVNAKAGEGLANSLQPKALPPISVKGKEKPVEIHRIYPN
jgi:class 3 adenylate cyclase